MCIQNTGSVRGGEKREKKGGGRAKKILFFLHNSFPKRK